jgi:hypothetical protein
MLLLYQLREVHKQETVLFAADVGQKALSPSEIMRQRNTLKISVPHFRSVRVYFRSCKLHMSMTFQNKQQKSQELAHTKTEG